MTARTPSPRGPTERAPQCAGFRSGAARAQRAVLTPHQLVAQLVFSSAKSSWSRRRRTPRQKTYETVSRGPGSGAMRAGAAAALIDVDGAAGLLAFECALLMPALWKHVPHGSCACCWRSSLQGWAAYSTLRFSGQADLPRPGF